MAFKITFISCERVQQIFHTFIVYALVTQRFMSSLSNGIILSIIEFLDSALLWTPLVDLHFDGDPLSDRKLELKCILILDSDKTQASPVKQGYPK